MSSILKSRIDIIETLFKNSEIDYIEIKEICGDSDIFENPQKRRLVNSFLFSFMKIQDSIGGKLFKEVLYELKEIEFKHMPMLDILYKLEELKMLDDVREWDILREIRNDLSHEYPMEQIDRFNTLKKTIWGYQELKIIFEKIKNYLIEKNIIKDEK